MEADREFTNGLRKLLAARRMEDAALLQDQKTADTLFRLAGHYRDSGVEMMVGDCIGGEEAVQPPVIRPAKCRRGWGSTTPDVGG